ncbi:germin-like protein subfamily T member 2, partial [Papaver somniferum]|uniref:germin-like protein subfamily T member 2 n=1 Tax=Papaver somniferum TaxID=3469 RepID=UPI000E704E4A
IIILPSSVFNCDVLFPFSCFSADPDPLQDFCVADLNSTIIVNGYPCKPVSQVTSNDFFFSGLINAPSTANPLGHGVRIGNVSTFHGLNTLGLMVNRIDLTPGGVTPIHRHPRASEANIVLKGKVLSGFISASDVLYLKVQKDGELFIIPRGLVHFATNVGPQKAVLIAGYNSQLPGFASIPSNLFASTPTIPNYILAKNFRVDEKFTAIMKSKFSPTGSLAIANGDDI